MPLRVVFFGTPSFAVPSLNALVRSPHQVVGVVTQPDRPRGRGQKILPSAVKALAQEHGLHVIQPARLKDPSLAEVLAALQPDIGIVAAYGRLLPQSVLDLPRLGMINVHASLLPRWRGAAPIHRAILAGDRETGITIMRVVLALDAGPMLDRVVTPIDVHETSAELEARLASMGADLLVSTLDRLAAGATIDEVPQDEARVTYAARLERSESPINWAQPAMSIHNQIRGLHPWPLASTTLAGRRFLILRSLVELVEGPNASPGSILTATGDTLIASGSSGTVRILEIQPEGRRAMKVRDFLNGTRLVSGDRFF